jgi:hypothetical protein
MHISTNTKLRWRGELDPSPGVGTIFAEVLSKKVITRNDNSHAAASIQLLTRSDRYSRVSKLRKYDFCKMQLPVANPKRVLCEVRLRLLALSVAILGLVLAPLGRVG